MNYLIGETGKTLVTFPYGEETLLSKVQRYYKKDLNPKDLIVFCILLP
jgi:hypothetical protein